MALCKIFSSFLYLILGIAMDKEVAFYLYHQAAKSGLQAVHHNLGALYTNGTGMSSRMCGA